MIQKKDFQKKDFQKEKLVRFSITVPENLLNEFESNFPDSNRSEHIRDLMRQRIVSERWKSGNKKIFATAERQRQGLAKVNRENLALKKNDPQP